MSLRLAARLARREVRRRRGRSALVALLVALPVAGMAVAITLLDTTDQTPREEWREQYGDFDAVSYQPTGQGLPALPAGSSTVAVRQSFTPLRSVTGDRTYADITDLPLADPRLRPTVELVAGRAPERAGEVALSPDLADALDLGVGDRLELDPPSVDGEVVGLAEQPHCLGCRRIVVAPGQDLPGAHDDGVRALIDLPDDVPTAELQRLRAGGVEDISSWITRPVGSGIGPSPMAWTFVAGAVVLTVMGIVIAAAFAVGARRQLATLGQLSANGAAPRTLVATLVLQGTFTGIVGGAAGLALAWVALVGGRRYVEVAIDSRIDGYDVAPWLLAGAVAVGVAAATIAALLPARTAARVPTLQAMAGRRPLSRIPRSVLAGGVAAVASGLGLLAIAVLGAQGGTSSNTWTGLAIAGGVAELLGACAVAPVLAARLEPLARRLQGNGRLAARSLARQRTRSGAVIAAVCAAGALAVCAAAVVRGSEVRDARDGRVPDEVVVARTIPTTPQAGPAGELLWPPAPPGREARAALAAAVPDAAAVPLRVAVGPWELSSDAAWAGGGARSDVAVVADDAVLDAFEVDEDSREVLADRGVVVLQPGNDDVTVRAGNRTWTTRTVTGPRGPADLSILLVTPLTARDARVEVRTGATLFRNPDPLTDDERDALTDLLFDDGFRTMTIDWHTPRTGPSPFQVQLLLSGAALLFSVLVVGASLALAAAESRDERDALTLVGAPPRVLARAAGAKAGLLSALGGLLALPIGFLPVAVFCLVDEGDLPLRVPWPTIGALVGAVPLIAAVVAWSASGAAQRLRPVRISTAVFE